jgi:hypothetical protein
MPELWMSERCALFRSFVFVIHSSMLDPAAGADSAPTGCCESSKVIEKV